MNRIAITAFDKNIDRTAFVMLDENRQLTDFELLETTQDSILNNIYIGRVENIVNNINSAFVKIGPDRNCYLSLDNAKEPIYIKKQSKKDCLSIGDEILVQVIKDAVKTKDPVVSCDLAFHGKHCLLTTRDKSLGVSKKIPKEKAASIRELLEGVISEADNMSDFGLVVRTSASKASLEEIEQDLLNTILEFEQLLKKASHLCAFTKVSNSRQPYILKLKGLDSTLIDEVVTDKPDIYRELEDYFKGLEWEHKLRLYSDDKLPLNVLYNLKGQIDKLISDKVWLKSGANIIIEQLETLTVIDVNSGKNLNKNSDATAINCEAAIEIARQIRLRNISGMIIIDFINMNQEKDLEKVITGLKREISRDPVKCNYIDTTKLGLVELTRKKVRKSLKEML